MEQFKREQNKISLFFAIKIFMVPNQKGRAFVTLCGCTVY